jgi:polyprenyldihydroxybenzoate methyltransferase/3-demethylubiquinol 3-O-methyltransferase
VIDSEVKKFGAVGSGWWDTTSTAGTGPLHAMNPVRMGFIKQKCEAYRHRPQADTPTDNADAGVGIRGMRILDVGCGGGLASESLARLGAQVTAIDPSRENIAVASAHSRLDPQTASIRYIHATVGTLIDYIDLHSYVFCGPNRE